MYKKSKVQGSNECHLVTIHTFTL